ncbi:MAG TPA: outer membrane beta-barrel protein [Blastocatellia bacterium]|nr:outer membrane beta-barrel protein [Blastocatellia bacterium]
MQKLFLIAALTLALPVIAQAQEATRTEFFAGYSYMRLESSPNTQDQDLNGYNVSGAVTIFKKSLAIKADVSGHYGNVLVSITPRTDQRQELFLFGPQYSFRKIPRIRPFAHALFGAARLKVRNDAIGAADITDTGFAFAAGGGVDLKTPLGSKIAVRLFQADYVRTKLDFLGNGNTTSSNNIRVSTGVVLRFGRIE